MKKVLLILIRLYQKTAPLRPPVCRFHPSCSHYAYQALDKYGSFKGSWLSVKRLLKCHPFHPGGYDPLN